jgi:hypothetical protein
MPEILKQTSTQLIVGDAKSFGGEARELLLIALVLAGMFAAPVFFLSRNSVSSGKLRTLICNNIEPTQVNCTLTEQSSEGTVTTTSILNLKGAVFSSEQDEDSDGGTYYRCEVKLLNRQGIHSIPLQQFNYRSYEQGCSGARAIEAQINQLVKDPRVKFSTYQEDTRVNKNLPWLLAGIVGGTTFGIFVLLGLGSLHQDTWVFDRSKQQLIWQRQTLFGTRTKNYPFHDIRALKVSLYKDSDDDPSGKVEVLVKSNRPKELVLRLIPPSATGTDHQEKCRELGNAIHAFTKIPLKLEES